LFSLSACANDDAGNVVGSDRIRMLNEEFAFIDVNDGGAFINDAMIVLTEVMASNGIIHGIDAVLLPENAQDDEDQTIVDVALAINAETGEFGTLIAALTAADLVGALDGDDLFTVFAPTDAAFAAIDLNPENIGDVPLEDLTNILLYHVTNGSQAAADVVMYDQIWMLNGDFTTVEVGGGTERQMGGVYIDDAMVVQADVMVSNGIIHVVDAVLLPMSDPALLTMSSE